MERSSKWAFIVYPESAPDDWLDKLKELFVPFCVSPLHSPEVSASGEERKTHYHVMLDFESLKSEKQVSFMINFTNGTKPIIVQSPTSYYRYMIHIDNPDKQQFNGFEDILKFNGFISDKYEKFSEEQIDGIFNDICTFIDSHNITELATLIEFTKNPDYDISNFFRIIRHNTIFFNSYISSRRNRIKKTEINNLSDRLLAIERKLKR